MVGFFAGRGCTVPLTSSKTLSRTPSPSDLSPAELGDGARTWRNGCLEGDLVNSTEEFAEAGGGGGVSARVEPDED